MNGAGGGRAGGGDHAWHDPGDAAIPRTAGPAEHGTAQTGAGPAAATGVDADHATYDPSATEAARTAQTAEHRATQTGTRPAAATGVGPASGTEAIARSAPVTGGRRRPVAGGRNRPVTGGPHRPVTGGRLRPVAPILRGSAATIRTGPVTAP
jgi:molybdate transport system ATP-binding protein